MGKMKHIPLLLLAAVLAVGCSQDELFDPAGEGQRPLVIKATGLSVGCSQDEHFGPAGEGQRPLVIKATGLSVTEAGITRATVDGDWK